VTESPLTIYTIGHSTRPWEEFGTLLEEHRITRLVDVRAYPSSRRHPQFNSASLEASLSAVGIDYVHERALGGRRAPRRDSSNTAWRNDAFRGYADYMETDEFGAALDRLVHLAAARPTAIMCAEAVPWRCHRSLISDALVARGLRVLHILDGRAGPHKLTAFARIIDGRVSYATPDQQNDLFEGASALS
jgi:uncharacterized protein (DUF488 family)